MVLLDWGLPRFQHSHASLALRLERVDTGGSEAIGLEVFASFVTCGGVVVGKGCGGVVGAVGSVVVSGLDVGVGLAGGVGCVAGVGGRYSHAGGRSDGTLGVEWNCSVQFLSAVKDVDA